MRGDNSVMSLFKNDALKGMRYLVTGASSGIGKATAILLSECGAEVIVSGRDEIRLNNTLSELKGVGHMIAPIALENADQVYEWAKIIVETHGPFDGVFHSAGVELIRPIRMIKQAQLNDVLGSSLFAAFGIARAFSAKNALVEGGAIVFMSSLASTNGQIGMSAYSATKSAINGMVKSFACEMSDRRVRVNAIAAGAVHTPMLERVSSNTGEAPSKAYEECHLLGFGGAVDIANAALFLLSPMSSWITGTVMTVDGGYTVR